MWHTIETALDVLDIIVHWRFYVCLAGGVVLGILAYGFLRDLTVARFVTMVAGAVGILVGLVWELQS